ncbi:hypothetical protein JL720_12175 [Aureococcus anophagefferens]|nr:hypothetical protein JL720_12175 [Aureococcus anophagefferens]
MVRATAALLLLLRDAEAAYIAVVGPTGDDVIVTDLTPVRLQLNDDESYGLYEDGELLTELPHKNWRQRGAVTLTSLKCDGSAPDDYDVARIASVADATDVAGCEDVTGAGAKVVDAFHLLDEWDMVRTRSAELAGVVDAHVLVEADRFHDGTPRAAEFWRRRGRLVPGAAPVLNLTVRTWPPEAGEDDGDLHDRGEASRNGVLEALRAFGPALGLEATDVVVVSDVDEIPNRETVRRLKVAAECDKRRIARGLLPVLATPASLLMSHHHSRQWTPGGRWAGPSRAARRPAGRDGGGRRLRGGAAVFPAEFGVGEARYVLFRGRLGAARPAADMFPGRDKSGFVGPGLVADWQPRSLFDNAGWHLSYFPRAGRQVDEPGRLRLVAASLERKLAHHGHREFSDELLRCAGLLDFSATRRPATRRRAGDVAAAIAAAASRVCCHLWYHEPFCVDNVAAHLRQSRRAHAAPRVEVLERAARRPWSGAAAAPTAAPARASTRATGSTAAARLAALEAPSSRPPRARPRRRDGVGRAGDVDRGHAAAAAAVAVGATRVAATLRRRPAPPAPEAPPTPRDEADALAALLAWIDGGLGAPRPSPCSGAARTRAAARTRRRLGRRRRPAPSRSRELRLTAAGAAALGDHAGLVPRPPAPRDLYGAKFAAPQFLLFYDDASQARGEAFARDHAGAWAPRRGADAGPRPAAAAPATSPWPSATGGRRL